MDFKKATLIDLMRYLEDLEQDSILQNINMEEALEKRYKGKIIPKDIYAVLLNTIKMTAEQGIKVDGVVITEPTSKEMVVHNGRIVSPMDNMTICDTKSSKELGAWMMDRPEWILDRVNSELGAEFLGKESSDTFSYNVNNGMLVIVGDGSARKYFFKKDFVALGYENGNILLLKDWYNEKNYYEVVDSVHYNNTDKEAEIA